ncbi:hypothetical protein CTKA_00559 [Chthonomonas calidirosea]|uniref:Uncharacterized protein n=1 Tax=Chthonomonas calidirosea (strain DSM 23976 / ICMP 18418 / T49) TaxID=1303518 RepID=S0ETH7_CHTCT|nr:hypothetical protein CCALI_00596 [Chthonomonas calidirosea T49]CEK14812.1 hypothetical protein CTKA_00559 [Chthonomonas calidirosea]
MAIEKQHLSVVKSSQNPIVFIREVWQERA